MAQATFSVRMDFYVAEARAKENFPQGMTPGETNEEIRKTRYGEEDSE